MQSIVLTCLLLLSSSVAFAQTTRSERLFKEPISDFVFDASLGNEAPSVIVWYYLPENIKRNTPIVFLMHGSSRTGKEARDLGLVYAKRQNIILLAPEFSQQQYPGDSYAFGNMIASGSELLTEKVWAFTTIERIFDIVRKNLHLDIETYDIVGHSAGGQFVQRLVLFAPSSRFRRAVASSPGRYVLPSMSKNFPYGLKGTSLDSSGIARVFSKDLVLLLGDRDTVDRDREPQAMDQGANRFARGLRFFALATEEASRLKIPLAWRLRILYGGDHSPGPAVQAAFEELFK